jgi:acetyl esterase/lipase
MEENKTLLLWENEPPCSSSEDDFKPYLETFLIDTDQPLGAVLICPGGGYGQRAEHEGGAIAKAFNSKGLHAFVVQYRVAPHRHPAPLLDVSKAIRMIRSNAEKWRVKSDKIAVCGFSAGGHLACSHGVLYNLEELSIGDPLERISNRPNAMILCYALITSDKPFRHEGSFQNLLGDNFNEEFLQRMSPDKHVNPPTPPTFLWHTAEDPVVPVENALIFAQVLQKHKIPFERHVFPFGRHGLGLAEEFPNVAKWFELCVDWLTGMEWKNYDF